jgi:hypothetical protein
MRAGVLLPLLLLALTACTDKGYPSTDAEMWGVVVVMLGLFALAGFFLWCVTR